MVIEVDEGKDKPYYLREKGPKPAGVYKRVGRSIRKANEDEILRMIMSSKKYIYENDISEEQNLSFNALTRAFNQNNMELTERNMVSLGIKNSQDKYTNLGFILSDQSDVTVKVAEYDKDRNFKLKKQFTGSLIDLFHHVKEQADRLNDVSAKIDIKSFKRKEKVSYPGASLREMILNAFVHAEYEEYMKKKEEIPRQGNAHLSEKEVKKFYRYYFSLLDYTNKKFKVKPAMEINPYGSVDPQKLIDVIEVFWENKDTIIDEYLKKNPLKLSPRGMRSIEAFKDGIRDEFILVQYEKEYAVFMNEEHVFMVKGLNVNIDEVIDPMSLPTIVTTALIPYEGHIVYDSVLQTMPIGIGPNTAKTFEKEMEKLPKLYTLKKRELN